MGTFQMLDGGNSEAQDRLATSFLLAQSSPGLAATGVLSGLVVTQTTTASGAVLIAAGAAPVQASVGTGVALLVNDTQATLDVFTANPMGGLPRNDVVAFDSVTKAIIAIIGTPNAAPTDPTVPDTACPLARLRHAASATTIPTAKIDDLRVATSLVADSTLPLGFVGAGAGSGDYTGTSGSANVNVPVVAGRRYRVTAYISGSQVSATGNVTVTLKALNQVATRKMIDTISTTAGVARFAYGAMVYLAGTTQSEQFYMMVSSSAGALRVVAGDATITVEDIGT